MISSWSPFRHLIFRLLWVAGLVANVGAWMYSAAAAWLMTNLRCRPSDRINGSGRCQSAHVLVCTTGRRVSRYRQQATFHLSSRDIGYDRIGLVRDAIIRRPSECMDVVLFVFLVNALWALEGPAWQSLVPELVPKEDLSAAIAANSVGINISRAIGPALAGVLITGIGIVAPFWLYAFSNAGLILVFLWWRTSQPPGRPLPTEIYRRPSRELALRAQQSIPACDFGAVGRIFSVRQCVLGAPLPS